MTPLTQQLEDKKPISALKLFEEVRIRNIEARKWFLISKFLIENAIEKKGTLKEVKSKLEEVYYGN